MTRERELWTKFIEERKCGKPAKRPRIKKHPDETTAVELEAALDDLVNEAEQRRST
jgi:hypothetical protein